MTTKENDHGYVSVNGLRMYYEMQGTGKPLVLLHGAFSAVGTSFGGLIPLLAKYRQVIAFELQGHGRTADIDRPLSVEAMAEDVSAAIKELGLPAVDLLGYSLGGSVALHTAIQYPGVVRKLILMSVSYTLSGIHAGLIDGLGEMKAEMMHGSPWHDEYMKIAPRPEDFARLFAKKTQMDQQTHDIPAESIKAIQSPTLLIIGDSDLVVAGGDRRPVGQSAVRHLAGRHFADDPGRGRHGGDRQRAADRHPDGQTHHDHQQRHQQEGGEDSTRHGERPKHGP